MILPNTVEFIVEIEKVLAGIKKTAGYRIDMKLQVVELDPNLQDSFTGLVTVERESPADESPIDFTDIDLEYSVVLTIRQPESDTIPLHRWAMIAAADVHQAIMADAHQKNTAQNTEWSGTDYIDATEEGLYFAAVRFRSRVRFPIDQPYDPVNY